MNLTRLRKTLKNSNVSKEVKTICKNDLAFLTNNTAYEKLNCRIVAEKNEKLLKKGSVDYFIGQVISVELSKIIANNNNHIINVIILYTLYFLVWLILLYIIFPNSLTT